MKGKKSSKRKVEILVLSDIHLGTFGCRAEELCQYLKSIDPQKIILNGDILDIWQFKKSYWPKSHMKVIKIIINWIYKGKEVIYITGNHDEMLRKFTGFQMNTFSIKNKLVLSLDDKKAWFFHGDVFDVTMQYSKWLVRLGSIGYDLLIMINYSINAIYHKLGKEKVSISKKIKNKVKNAVKFVNDFEKVVADIAIENKYHFVVCGHIHHPEIKKIKNDFGEVSYLNSGDWIENLTALEYNKKEWSIYHYDSKDFQENEEEPEELQIVEKSAKQIFDEMLMDFHLEEA